METNQPIKKKQPIMRLQAKNWLLTFPQCSVTKEEALEKLLNTQKTPPFSVQGAIVAQETHADGNHHLHIAIFLEKKIRIRDQTYWDFIVSKHGNYQTMKSVKGSIAYLKKEDQTPLIYGNVPDTSKESRVSKSDIAANMIKSGSSLSDVAEELPGFFLLNQSKILSFKAFCMNQLDMKSKKKLKSPIMYTGEDNNTLNLVEWLNGNLFKERRFKQKQLYISGPKDIGKTSLLLKLNDYLRIYEMPLLEDFYDLYDDDRYDLVVLDEFRGQKFIQFLNLWAQGGLPLSVRIKGGQTLKRKNLPFIICSNYELFSVYKNAEKIDTLKTRFYEIDFTGRIDLENIKFEEVNSEVIEVVSSDEEGDPEKREAEDD